MNREIELANQIKDELHIECLECKSKYNIIREYSCIKPKNEITIYYLKDKNTGESIRINL